MANIPVVHLELLELWNRVSELQSSSLKAVSTANNITGSGTSYDPVVLMNDISVASVTASFYGDGSGLYNISSGSVDLSNYATLTGVSGTFISQSQLSTNNVLYVSSDGSDTNNGSFNNPLKTLQAANDLASSSYNDFSKSVTVKVLPGTYSGFNLTRKNTYFVNDNTNLRQKAVTINGPIKIQVSGTQKYNEICGFDGFLFNTGSGTEPVMHVQGTGSSCLYIQNSQFYSNTTNSNGNLLKIDGVYGEEKVVLRGCNFSANQPGADLIKISGGDIELDSCTLYVSGSGASSTISASGDVYIAADRVLIENYSSAPAVSFNSARSFVLTNSSITKGGTAKAIQGSSTAGMVVLNSLLGSYVVGANLSNISDNLTISGSTTYYGGLTSLVPLPNYQITVVGGVPLTENHGKIYATSVSASSGITGSFSGSGASIYSITASNINNFQNDVRNQLSGGYGIQYTTGTIAVDPNILSNITASTISASSLVVDYIDFNTSSFPNPPAAPAPQIGRIFYNGASGDLSTYLDANGLYLNNGQQLVQKCINQSGAGIGKGKVVHITGSTETDTPRIALADWTNDNLSANTLGITMNSSSNGGDSFVIVQGVLTGVDLSYLTSPINGQILYLSSSGQITNVKPTAPNHTVTLGQIVAKAGIGQNTTIYTSINNGYELSELHDVATNGKSNGDLLAWNSGSSVWTNTNVLSGSYTFVNNQIIETTNGNPALRITQTGAGPALLVEDTASVDPTPFIITSNGWIGISTSTPSSSLHIAEGGIILGSANNQINNASNVFVQGQGNKIAANKTGGYAQGSYNIVSGAYAHAEGSQNTAVGLASHAEGQYCIAIADYSHAEGNYTIASASYQHVQGQWNQTSSTALMLVGNGTSGTRSNILEVYTSSVDISGSLNITQLLSAPLSTKLSNSPGSVGQICWDTGSIYVCVASNTWKSSSLL